MSRTWKCIIVLAMLLIIGAVTVPVILVARFAGQGGAVRAEIARIKAEGAPTCAADLAGKPIPDGENAAVVYQKCFTHLPKSPNSRDSYKLANFLDSDKRTADPELWAQAKAIVNQYALALSLAEKAAAMPECRFKVDWGDPFDSKFNYRSHFRFLARLAAARALLDARSGNAHGAVESVALIIRMSDSLKDEPELIGALIRFIIIRTAAQALANASECTAINQAEAERMCDVLKRVHLQDSVVKALEGARAEGIIVFSQVRDGRMPDLVGDKEVWGTIQRTYRSFPFSLAIANDQAYFLREMRDRIEKAALPYRVLAKQPENREQDTPRYAFLSTLLLGPGPQATAGRDRAIAALAGSRVFLGLLAHHDHFGSYPAKLDDLRAKLNWQLPEDPFSGKPFIYRRQGKGFILYSIGDDLKDNGGREAKPATGPQAHTKWPGKPIQSDIVWKLDKR